MISSCKGWPTITAVVSLVTVTSVFTSYSSLASNPEVDASEENGCPAAVEFESVSDLPESPNALAKFEIFFPQCKNSSGRFEYEVTYSDTESGNETTLKLGAGWADGSGELAFSTDVFVPVSPSQEIITIDALDTTQCVCYSNDLD